MTKYQWINSFTVISFLLSCLMVTPTLAENDYEDGEIIVSLIPGETINELNNRWNTTLLDSYPEGNLYLIYAGESEEELEELAELISYDPAVDWAEANYYQETPEGVRQMVINAVEGDYVDFEDQLIVSRIGLEEAHLITRGSGVVVAVLDTGVDPNHEALQGHLLPGGYDFVDNDPDPWDEANGIDDDLDGMTDEGFGHGTMVAGIVALIAPEAKILPIRILNDEGRSDAFRIVEAIDYAVNHGAHIINMSFGTPHTISAISVMVELSTDSGIVAVAGAGNQNTEEPPYYPAIDEETFMVTALDSLDRKADFADWNDEVLVSAPGTGVRSALPNGQWGLGSGCSFATPFVSGEIALIQSIWPLLGVDEIKLKVEAGVQPIYQLSENIPFFEKLGRGRIYIPDALSGAMAGIEDGYFPDLGDLVAYPNPTRGGFQIQLSTTPGLPMDISIFDAAGRLIQSDRQQGPVLRWDGRDRMGRAVSTGVYYLVLRNQAEEQRTSIRIVR